MSDTTLDLGLGMTKFFLASLCNGLTRYIKKRHQIFYNTANKACMSFLTSCKTSCVKDNDGLQIHASPITIKRKFYKFSQDHIMPMW